MLPTIRTVTTPAALIAADPYAAYRSSALGEKQPSSRLSTFREAQPKPLEDRGTITKEVPPETGKLLQVGDWAIERVRRALPFGAGNIEHTLSASRGRAYDAVEYTREGKYPPEASLVDDRDIVGWAAARATAGKGGLCQEHAETAAAALNLLLTPGEQINVCKIADLDHVFVVLGPLTVGERVDLARRVVVDAWVPASQALLGEDFKFFAEPGSLVVKRTFSADGEDIVSQRVPQVRDYWRKVLADGEAPRLSEQNIAIWPDTHATCGDVRMNYESRTATTLSGVEAAARSAPSHAANAPA